MTTSSRSKLARAQSLAEAVVTASTRILVFHPDDLDALVLILEELGPGSEYQAEVVKAVRDTRKRLLALAAKYQAPQEAMR